MRTTRLLMTAAIAGIPVIASCGHAHVPRSHAAGPATVSATTGRVDPALPTEVPSINWDQPVLGGLSTTTTAARRTGRLPFNPIMPTVAGQLASVQVSNPAETPAGSREVALIYHFPLGAGFPTDPRLVIQEHEEPRLTTSDLQAMAAADPEHETMVTLGGTEPALLMSANGTDGRIMFIFHQINFDITGPDVTKASVLAIANAVYTAANS